MHTKQNIPSPLQCHSLHRLLALLAVLCTSLQLVAQSPADPAIRTHAFSLGVGTVRQLDTYLSPRQYNGYRLSLMHETMRTTSMANQRITYQTLWQGTFSSSHNTSHTSRYLGGHLDFDALWHYNWTPVPGLRLLAGGAIGADAGFLYATRGGNNPAQGRLSASLQASFQAIYRLSLGKKNLRLRYQANLPLAGMMFSPHYGQSYYDIYQGNTAGNLCFSHPANAFTLWQQFTVDIPLGKQTTVRAGYLCDIRQSHLHNIKHHESSHIFMIGLVRTFERLSD